MLAKNNRLPAKGLRVLQKRNVIDDAVYLLDYFLNIWSEW